MAKSMLYVIFDPERDIILVGPTFTGFVKRSHNFIHLIFVFSTVVFISWLQMFALINGGLSFWGYDVLANGSNLEALACSTISLLMCSFALFVASLSYILCARYCGRKRLASLVNVFFCSSPFIPLLSSTSIGPVHETIATDVTP